MGSTLGFISETIKRQSVLGASVLAGLALVLVDDCSRFVLGIGTSIFVLRRRRYVALVNQFGWCTRWTKKNGFDSTRRLLDAATENEVRALRTGRTRSEALGRRRGLARLSSAMLLGLALRVVFSLFAIFSLGFFPSCVCALPLTKVAIKPAPVPSVADLYLDLDVHAPWCVGLTSLGSSVPSVPGICTPLPFCACFWKLSSPVTRAEIPIWRMFLMTLIVPWQREGDRLCTLCTSVVLMTIKFATPASAAMVEASETEAVTKELLIDSMTSATEMPPTMATVLDGPQSRPRAPLEALLPATEQRFLVEKACKLLKKLEELKLHSNGGSESAQSLWSDLLKLFATSKDETSRGVGLYSVLGDPATHFPWPKLSGANVRAALDIYTSKLQFGDSYILTASADVKKAWIRKYGALPDVKQVVTADLDLRDLYRNTIQTAIDDLQAELLYQQRKTAGFASEDTLLESLDLSEIASLLEITRQGFEKWFAFIDPLDVHTVQAELERETSQR
jgi:hypothetical protein